MSTPAADYLVDRRRLSRQVGFWRVIAFVAAALLVLALAARFLGGSGLGGPHIARLTLSGFISGNEETLKLIRQARDSTSVKAAVVNIDSPGGTTEGSEEIYDELRLLAAKKPVVAVVGTMAASGAYIAALGTDRVFARGNSIVGSIGVLVEYPNVSGLMDKLGVKLESIKSSPLKASPNGFEPTSEEARAAMAALIADSFAWFKDLVKDRRSLSDDELAKVDDGRVFTGRQGLPLKLADAIGGEREAIAWLESDKGVAKDLPVRDYQPKAGLGRRSTCPALAAERRRRRSACRRWRRHRVTAIGSAPVDGLVSVWQLSSRRNCKFRLTGDI